MSDRADQYITYLKTLAEPNRRGALAVLRHSLAFAPGCYPRAYPYVEPFAGNTHERSAWRLALYVVAGLFARHPKQSSTSFASAFGEVYRLRSVLSEPKGIESRFIALLEADSENISDYLRQAVSLISTHDIGLDFGQLLRDLTIWIGENVERREKIRQDWARDFYRAAQPTPDAPLETA